MDRSDVSAILTRPLVDALSERLNGNVTDSIKIGDLTVTVEGGFIVVEGASQLQREALQSWPGVERIQGSKVYVLIC